MLYYSNGTNFPTVRKIFMLCRNQFRSFFAVEKKEDADLPSIDWGRADMLIELALNEDLDTVGDVTTNSIIPEDMESRAILRCKTDGTVVAGLAIAERVFKLVEPRLEFKTFVEDGEICNKGDEIAAVEGPVRGILTGQRPLKAPKPCCWIPAKPLPATGIWKNMLSPWAAAPTTAWDFLTGS